MIAPQRGTARACFYRFLGRTHPRRRTVAEDESRLSVQLKLGTGEKMLQKTIKRLGDVKWGLIAILLGLPLPVVILFFLCGGCNSN